MIVHHMRYDILISMGAAFLAGWGVGKGVDVVTAMTYQNYVEEHTVAENEVGGIAGESIFQAQSIEDILSHDTFTIVSEGISYMNDGGGYYGNMYLQNVELASGERVAAVINNRNVQNTGDSIYSGDNVLPVGQVVYEDLAGSENFMNQIQSGYPLDRTDFYVDMMGMGGIASLEDYQEYKKMPFQIAAFILVFPLFHALGSRLGLFPYFFEPREKKKKSQWDY